VKPSLGARVEDGEEKLGDCGYFGIVYYLHSI
jgi:hypothetical protein